MEDMSFAPMRFGLQFWENAFSLAADSLHSFSTSAGKPPEPQPGGLGGGVPAGGLADVLGQQIRLYRDQTEQSVASARAFADNLRNSMFDGMAAVCSAATQAAPPTAAMAQTPEPTAFRTAA